MNFKKPRKKGELLGLLVAFGFALMLIIGLGWLVFKILTLVGVITPDIQCDWSIVLIAITKLGTAGLADIPPECQTSYVTITRTDLDKLTAEAERAMKLYAKDDRYVNARAVYKTPSNRQLQYEWALNKLVAKELQRCWGKAWEGKLPLFDSWWNLIDWQGFSSTKPGDGTAAQRQYSNPVITLPFTDDKKSLLQVYGPPTFCIYCSRIKFDSSVKEALGGKTQITSLTEYMKATQARPGSPESIFEYILDESADESNFASVVQSLKYEYNIDEPYGVEFVRINAWGGALADYGSDTLAGLPRLLGLSPENTPSKINRLVLIPDRENVYPLGRTAIVNGENNPIQCLEQIT